MTNPLKSIKKRSLSFLRRGDRSNRTITQPPQSPIEDMADTRRLMEPSITPPQSEYQVLRSRSPSPVSPNRLVALPQNNEEERILTASGTNTQTALDSPQPTQSTPPHSPTLSILRRTMSSTGGTFKRHFSFSNPSTKDIRVLMKGRKRSNTVSYSRLPDGSGEVPGYWFCCVGGDDDPPQPCYEENDNTLVMCKRCGHRICDGCEVFKIHNKKEHVFERGEGRSAPSSGVV